MKPRPAATIVVARPGAAGPEVLVLERSGRSRFGPGFAVFPGGSLEPGDDELARRWFGDPAEAYRACAVRELYEEAGILATAAGLCAEPSGAPIESIDFEPPPPAALPEMARWIAPEGLPVRFDTRFYAIAAPPGLEPVPDGVEIERAWWADPAGVLDAAANGEASLMWPTLVTLRALRACRSVEDALALRVPQVAPA
ncbi:MAG TPA: NUDIX hydrolase [Actinomycetota bacterium]|nr:NUDIX hydrolase [Actinomycetota bacterium]